MSSYLVIAGSAPKLFAETVAPESVRESQESATSAWNLATGLVARGHSVTVLSAAAEAQASAVPGLARRLRKVEAAIGDQAQQFALFESHTAGNEPQLLVVGLSRPDPGEQSLWLGAAARTLSADGLLNADVALGWDEISAVALGTSQPNAKFFVLPRGTADLAISRDAAKAFGIPDSGHTELAAIGATAAQVVFAPSAESAHSLAAHPALRTRARDEPIMVLPFGADEPPNNPETDAALAAPYSSDTLGGKDTCRRALLQETLGLTNRAKSLVLAVPRLRGGDEGALSLAAIEAAIAHETIVLVLDGGDPATTERVKILAIENPTKIALVGNRDANAQDAGATWRQILAAADACFALDRDVAGRAASLAQRYGAFPVIIEPTPQWSRIVDLDEQSATGTGVICSGDSELESAVLRLAAARRDLDGWRQLRQGLMRSAPSWGAAAELFEGLVHPLEQNGGVESNSDVESKTFASPSPGAAGAE